MMLRAPQAQGATTLLLRNSPSRQATASSSTSSSMHRRTFASIPHHLARQNNGMVNVFVKSTKVPRPSRIIKTFNRLKPLPTPPSAEVAVGSSLNGDDMNHEAAPSTASTTASSADIKEEEHLSYAGYNIPITSQLKIVMPGVDDTPRGVWPVFRMMVCLLLL